MAMQQCIKLELKHLVDKSISQWTTLSKCHCSSILKIEDLLISLGLK